MTLLSSSQHFSLDNFEGPLELLLHLVMKSEIDIFEVSIHEITEQFLQLCVHWEAKALESGADALSTAATLLYIKSKTLLPRKEQEDDDDELDPRFEMIHHLLDYCRFKEMGKVLARKAAEQSAFYYRESEEYVSPDRKPLGTDHLSISDLAKVFEESIVVAENRYGDAIEEEVFRVADKIRFLRTNLKKGDIIPLEEIFDPERSRGELVVFFLAMLELMKLGELAVVRREDQRLEVIRQESHESRNQSTRIEPGDNDYA